MVDVTWSNRQLARQGSDAKIHIQHPSSRGTTLCGTPTDGYWYSWWHDDTKNVTCKRCLKRLSQ